ncbi:rRNA biogenesis protein rrp5 [Vanrija albida]|uniref:rRNA biogenesis protein rrp5 n=1 Tax=Vanrija albida TaxID=181172 RepID=A0ABR3QEQ8_9TREE
MAPPHASKKRAGGAGASPSAKKPRTERAPREDHAAPRAAPAFTSALQSEEVDFPRGGGSSFTALEMKQIRAEGQREADAEVAANKKQPRKVSERHAKRIKKSKSTIDAERAERDKDTIRVEELSYKRLVPGTHVLARVHTVLPLHLVLSLPNNLLAHVPITEVSATLTAALNKDIDAMSEDGEDEEDDDEDTGAPELAELFVPGQYVTAKVLNLFPTASQDFIAQYPVSETTRLAARVELTLIPEKINGEIAKADVEAGFRIVGEVLSKEDKGYRVGLGLEGGVEGFITNDEVVANVEAQALIPGQLVATTVASLTAGGRVVQLSLNQQTLIHSSLTEVSNIGSLLPGQLVSCLVTAVVPSGLNVKVAGFFDGTIDIQHLGLGEADIDDRFKIGKKLKARILYDTVASSERRFALSVLPHIFNLASPLAADKKTPLEAAVPIGKTIPSVKIIRVVPDWGVVCRTDDGLEGFAHISHLADERVASLSAATGQFKTGTYHRARVIGHSPLDGVMLLSFEEKVLNQVFMQVGELEVGQVLKGTIRRLSDKGLFVNVNGSVDGVVWPLHYADIRLKHPEKRFKVGSSIKCRVFAVEAARNRVVLTAKKSLVESDLPVPKSFADVKAGEITPAVVSKILDKGCIVDLFGGLRAFVPQSEASQNFVLNLNDIFFVGKPVNVRITDVNQDSEKLVASVRQALPTAVAAAKLEVGEEVNGIVAQIHAEQVVISLVPSQLTALLSLSNLSNHRGMGVDDLRASLKVGDRIDDLVVVSKNPTSGLLIVANKRVKAAVKAASGVSASARAIDELAVGDVIPGRVIGRTAQGAMVKLGNNIRGRVAPTDSADDLALAAGDGALNVDDTVMCYILKIDAPTRNIDLSTRKSRVQPEAKGKIVDAEITSFADLKEGQAIRGLVRSVAKNGVFVSLGRNITARVMIKELFDDFVKDWKSRFTVNQLVSGKILSVDADKELVEMTFKTKARPQKAAKLSITDFKEGQKVTAAVKKVEPYGLFLRIDGSNISGLCHKSEISDNKKQDVSQALKGFREGDQVRAVITSVDADKGKINFSIKASHFGDEFAKEDGMDVDEEEEGDEEDDEEEGDEDEDDEEGEGEVLNLIDDEAEVEDDDEDDEDEEEEEGDDDDEEEESDGEEEEEIDDAPAHSSKAQKRVSTAAGSTALSLAGGFDWSGGKAGDDSDSDSDSESDEPAPKASSKANGKKKAVDLAATAAGEGQPETASEFERALLASPNSSFLWIQYMSFQLQLHEVDKARKIGRQALERIAFREEEEKLNVWMALINLEIGFGTNESTEKVFKEAVQYNDARTVYTRYADALVAAGKNELVEAVYQKLLKKFSAFPDSWARFAEFYLKSGNVEAARALLPRALQSLDKSKHVEMTEKMAVLEFKHGDAERGKTLFEGILDRYPKRLDVWNVYVDQVGKTGDIATVRSLIERALARKLTQKRAKFLFKKWLSLESRIGDAAGQDKAKARAREWVQANAKPADDESEEEESDEE